MLVPWLDEGKLTRDISLNVSPLVPNIFVDIRVEVPSIMKDLSDIDVTLLNLELEIWKELKITWLLSASESKGFKLFNV